MKSGAKLDWLRPEPPTEGWLVRDGHVLASVEVAQGRVARARGLLGRESIDGVLLIPGARSVHSFRMAFDLDVAFLDRNMVVIRTMRLHRHRVTLPVWRARAVLEAEAGAFGQWDLGVGDEIEVRSCDHRLERAGADESTAR